MMDIITGRAPPPDKLGSFDPSVGDAGMAGMWQHESEMDHGD